MTTIRSVVLALAVAASAGAQSTIEISPVVLDDEMRVDFESSRTGATDWPVAGEDVTCATRAVYEVCLDLQGHRVNRLGVAEYIAFTRPRSDPGASSRWLITGHSQGEFDDRTAVVSLVASGEEGSETFNFKIPIHSKSSTGFLSLAVTPEPAELIAVWIGSEMRVRIRAKNRLSDLAVHIPRSSPPTVDHDEQYWQIAEARWLDDSTSDLVVGAGEEVAVADVLLRSEGWNCLRTSILPTPKRWRDELGLRVNLRYASFGGGPRTGDLAIRIRFMPNLWSMLLALATGALVSVGVTAVGDSARRQSRKLVASLASTFLTGVVIIAIGIVLVSNDSEFRLLGYTLDPYQLLSIFLVGLFSGFFRATPKKRFEEWISGIGAKKNGD